MIDIRQPSFTRLPGSSRVPRLCHRAAAAPAPPLVQVASVARGRASAIHDTLRALQDQTLGRWTWVVVDATDGSVRARDVMARLSADPRVSVVRPTADANGSLLDRASRGETPYLCFLRPGDLLEPTALETWAWALATGADAGAVTSNVVRFGAVQGVERVAALGSGGYPTDGRSPPVLFVRRETYEDIGGAASAWAADEEIEALSFTLASRGGHVGVLPAAHVWRRVYDAADPCGAPYGRLPRVPLRRHSAAPTRFAETPPFENPLGGDGPGALFVIPYMFHGGAERAALDQVTALADRGWRVTVVALSMVDHTWRSAFSRVTADVHVPHEACIAWGDWDRAVLETPRFLSYLVESRGIDVMLLGGTMAGYGAVPWLRMRHPRLAVCAVRHAVDWPLLSFEFTTLLDAVLVSTRRVARQHRELGIPDDRLQCIVTGVDGDRWRPNPERRAMLRRWLEVPENAPVLVYSSRLTPDKQPLVFAETMALLRARGIDAYALVTGGGSERDALVERLAALALTDRVRLVGEVEDRRMPDIMAAGDVAFLPSQREGIALSLLEGMACGLPFVGTSNSSQDEVVTPDVGTLVPRSDPATEARDYAEALARILADRAALAEMGRRARGRIEASWSLARMADQLEAALNAAIERAGTPRDAVDAMAFARCLAGVALHSLSVDVMQTASTYAEGLAATLTRLGYDHAGRPLESTR